MLIGEVVKRSGLSKDGVRHYERLGIISSVRRPAGRRTYHDYDESPPEMIDRARQAQHLGVSLKEIAPLLRAHAERPMTSSEAIRFLNERRSAVRSKIEALLRVEEFIVQKLAGYAASTAHASS